MCLECNSSSIWGWGRVRSSIQDSRVFFFGDFFFLTKKGQHCCANNWLLINFTGHKKKTLSNLPPVQKKRNIKWLEVISCITLLFLLIVLCLYICMCLIIRSGPKKSLLVFVSIVWILLAIVRNHWNQWKVDIQSFPKW